MSYADEVLADSPDWYYRFQEPSGAFIDSSTHNVTCTETGSITRSLAGPVLGGAAINPTPSTDYLTLAYTATARTNETLEFWVKTTSTGHMTFEQNREGGGNGMCLQASLGTTSFGAGAGQITAFFNQTSLWRGAHTTATVNDGAWHHVVCTYTGSSTLDVTDFAIYIDGVSVSLTWDGGSGGASPPWTGQSNMSLFVSTSGVGVTADVTVAEMAFYGSALSSGRVAAHYAARNSTDPIPGGLVEWDNVFVVERIAEWTITRGASAELTGGTNPGQATVILINTPDDRYNPENTGGDLYGFLHDGPRVWIGVNEDGTVEPDDAKTVYGLFAGHITDLSVLPVPGAAVAPLVEIVCADPLEWASRQKVRLAPSTTRSQADIRSEVLDALGWTTSTLPVEPSTLPLSSADGYALRILDDLNASNGTRHFAKPEDTAPNWFRYVAVRRTSGLDGSSSAALDAGSDHVTGTTGWRRSADGIINQQKATVEPIDFPGRILVWEPDLLPFTVDGELIIWAQFGDYVGDPEADIDYTGSTLTVDVEPFGDTAKITLTSAGTSSVTDLDVTGYLVQRGSVESVVIDDLTSQSAPRGVRAGPDLTGDYLGTLTSARGFASHIVYRFANPLYRPTVTVVNWIPEMFDLDLFDRVSITVAELSITDRIFEIVGLTLHGEMAALDVHGNPVVQHTATYVLQESREQTDPGWFILDDSLLDGSDVLAY